MFTYFPVLVGPLECIERLTPPTTALWTTLLPFSVCSRTRPLMCHNVGEVIAAEVAHQLAVARSGLRQRSIPAAPPCLDH